MQYFPKEINKLASAGRGGQKSAESGNGARQCASSGMILLLTLMLLVLLTFEVATISLVAQRGLGEEAALSSQNIEARRAAEATLNRLQNSLDSYLQSHTPTQAATAFASGGGSDMTPAIMTITNPGTGATDNTDTTVSAWMVERRGYWFHLLGRAQAGGVDIIEHRWVYENPCHTASVLTTILPAVVDDPGGYNSIAISPIDGRAFFGQNAVSGQMYTWSNGVLSTILPAAVEEPGVGPMVISPIDGRAFFGQGTDNPAQMFTWKNGVLSTLLPTAITDPGYWGDLGVSPLDGRVYFGGGNNSYTWLNGVLSTILSGSAGGNGGLSVSPVDGRVYIGTGNATRNVYSWQAGTGLSTVTPATVAVAGYYSMAVSPADGRVFFGQNANPGQFWTWKTGVLSTILPVGVNTPGYFALAVNSSGRVFFGTQGASGQEYTWTSSSGLSTLLPTTGTDVGWGSTYVSPYDGRAYFGSSNQLYTWYNGTLSTIMPAATSYPGDWSSGISASPVDGRLFFGQQNNPGQIWTWKSGVLSTLFSSTIASPGVYGVAPDGRVYMTSAGTQIYTWYNGVLSTMLPSPLLSVAGDAVAISPYTGHLFFGQDVTASNFWEWAPPQNCSARGF